MQNQSHFDPSRKTIGAIYNDAAANNTDKFITNGDLTNEIQSSLVEDINETIASKPFGERSYYIGIYEKKDLQMPRAIQRKVQCTLYRPYPEDDSLVFFVDMAVNEVLFCWCLPHWSEMDNILENHYLYEKEYVSQITDWKRNQLENFGFVKVGLGEEWAANPNFRDKKMKPKVRKPTLLVP
jgi:hypothetical protein